MIERVSDAIQVRVTELPGLVRETLRMALATAGRIELRVPGVVASGLDEELLNAVAVRMARVLVDLAGHG